MVSKEVASHTVVKPTKKSSTGSSAKRVNRTITAKDVANAKRLWKVWNKKKDDLALTQIKAAAALGISQAAFNQYLSGTIALNTDMVLKLSLVLEVSPPKLDPALKPYFPNKD